VVDYKNTVTDYENGNISELEAARLLRKLRCQYADDWDVWKIYYIAGKKLLHDSPCASCSAIEVALGMA